MSYQWMDSRPACPALLSDSENLRHSFWKIAEAYLLPASIFVSKEPLKVFEQTLSISNNVTQLVTIPVTIDNLVSAKLNVIHFQHFIKFLIGHFVYFICPFTFFAECKEILSINILFYLLNKRLSTSSINWSL